MEYADAISRLESALDRVTMEAEENALTPSEVLAEVERYVEAMKAEL